MSKTLNTIIAIALVGIFPVLSIYAGTQGDGYTQENAVLIATQFLKSSPTYSFDGIEDSIEVVTVDTIRMPYSWYVTIKFTSRNSGYGDRTGQMLAQVLTEHTMVILVSKGEILSAKTDDVYDELTETLTELPNNHSAEEEEIALEWLRNAPTFSFDGVEDSMIIVDSIIQESYPEQYIITIDFECKHAGYGDRTGEILAQVITEHTAIITIVTREVQGAVIDGAWDELNQREKVVSELLPPEAAVQIVIDYLKENYPEASELKITDEWSIANLTPEGLLGASTLEYSGDGWIIRVSYPVVWKPTYNFEVEHAESEFLWTGTVDQSGIVTE